MSENNPYASPSASLDQGSDAPGALLSTPRAVPVGRAWGWIQEGFGFFTRSPMTWILTILIAVVIMIVLNIIPIVGQIAWALTVYVFAGGFMLGCHAQAQGQPFEVRHLFAGFNNPGKLILLSLGMMVVSGIIMAFTLGPALTGALAGGALGGGDEAAMIGGMGGLLMGVLIAMLLMIPISMAIWFAPALIAIHDTPIIDALKLSFSACLKNILPFFIYGLIAFVLYILAVIPLGLGLFVFLPTMAASMYVAYREILTER